MWSMAAWGTCWEGQPREVQSHTKACGGRRVEWFCTLYPERCKEKIVGRSHIENKVKGERRIMAERGVW